MDALKSRGQMYDQIDLGKISRSGFDLSWCNKGTGKIGRIIPTRCTEVLPGDRFKGSSQAAVQFEPLAVPILANMYVKQEHFYVPNNILWKNWDKFITGGQNLDDTSVLPHTSLYDIMMALFNNTFRFFGSCLFPAWKEEVTVFDNKTCDVYVVVIDNPFDSDHNYNSVTYGLSVSRGYLQNFGEKYYCLDLLKPCFEVLDKIEEMFSVLSNADEKLAYKYYTFDKDNGNESKIIYGIPVARNLVQELFDGLSYDPTSTVLTKYSSFFWSEFEKSSVIVKDLIPMLKQYIATDTTKYMQFPLTAYTDEGMQLFEFLYDFYKPFIGIGSNLDYLNMPRISQKDWYYQLLLSYVFQKSDLSYFDTDNTTIFANMYVYESFGSFDEAMFSSESLSILPLRACYAIWYNYYRDQLLETGCMEPSTDDTVTEEELLYLIMPRQRCWAKDTFTTALSNPGTGSMLVPISVDKQDFKSIIHQNVSGDGAGQIVYDELNLNEFTLSDGTTIKLPTRFLAGNHESGYAVGNDYYGLSLDMLNRAQRAQKWLQKALIYGNRIQDRLYTSFGVKFLDNRLHLPEFLSSSSQLVQLSVNTNNTTIQDPQTGEAMSVAGDRSANAFAYDKGGDFNRFCEEHGLILSFLTIMPEATYPYSSSRLYSKFSKFDFAWPEFSTIGMDAVYLKELCSSSLEQVKGDGQEVFGYQGRYYDYKCKQDEEHGELQTSQNMYTFSREFNLLSDDKKPKLNYIFVHCWPSLDMFVVDSSLADYFRYDIHHSVAAERPLPVCGMYL